MQETRLPVARVVALALAVLATAQIASAQINGVVTDAQTGSTLSGIFVQAWTPCAFAEETCWQLADVTQTNSRGKYTLEVSGGSYRVLAYDGQQRYATQFAGDAESFDSTATSGAGSTVNFALQIAGVVNGNIWSSASSAQVVVAAYNLDGSLRSFSEPPVSGGPYSLLLPPGSYKLVAWDNSRTFATTFFNDAPDFASAAVVSVSPGGVARADFTLPLAARLSGTVKTAAGTPIRGAVVYAYAAGRQAGSATAGADGAFIMTLRAGTYRFVAADPLHVYATAFFGDSESFDRSPAVTVAAGDDRRNVDFTLPRGVPFSGMVTDASTGRGVPGATVAAYNVDGTLRGSIDTDLSGSFHLLLPPGDFKIVTYDARYAYATDFYLDQPSFESANTVASVSGVPVLLQAITLARAGRFAGTVRDAASAPLAGMVVVAYATGGEAAANATTAADGQYRLAVPAGSYRLMVYDPAFRYATAYASGAPSLAASPSFSAAVDTEQHVDLTMQRASARPRAVRH